jgi:dTDP-D-glucose 4,6-dehydratase
MVTNSESSINTIEFEGATVKDFKFVEDIMRTLQLMVEGHNLNLQAYLAKQPDNIKNFNIVLDVVEYFHAIAPLRNADTIELIIQVLDKITELAHVKIKGIAEPSYNDMHIYLQSILFIGLFGKSSDYI